MPDKPNDGAYQQLRLLLTPPPRDNVAEDMFDQLRLLVARKRFLGNEQPLPPPPETPRTAPTRQRQPMSDIIDELARRNHIRASNISVKETPFGRIVFYKKNPVKW